MRISELEYVKHCTWHCPGHSASQGRCSSSLQTDGNTTCSPRMPAVLVGQPLASGQHISFLHWGVTEITKHHLGHRRRDHMSWIF